jgi:hypothetical protein
VTPRASLDSVQLRDATREADGRATMTRVDGLDFALSMPMAHANRFPDTVIDTPDDSGPRRRTRAANDATIALDRQWSAASDLLDARIREIRGFLVDPRRFDSSAQTDLWVDDLEGVRHALDELRTRLLDAPPELLESSGAALATYLMAAFVWCGDIASDVKGSFRARQLRVERRRAERTSFIDDSEAYIECFLDPFYRALNVACACDPRGGEPIRASAERLQARIASLNWELRGAFPHEAH